MTLTSRSALTLWPTRWVVTRMGSQSQATTERQECHGKRSSIWSLLPTMVAVSLTIVTVVSSTSTPMKSSLKNSFKLKNGDLAQTWTPNISTPLMSKTSNRPRIRPFFSLLSSSCQKSKRNSPMTICQRLTVSILMLKSTRRPLIPLSYWVQSCPCSPQLLQVAAMLRRSLLLRLKS